MARWFAFGPGLDLRGRTFKGFRGWAGKPLHPPLTDVPITCYIVAAVFDIVSYFVYESRGDLGRDLFRAATYVIVFGAATSALTILTGFWDYWKGVDRHPTGWFGKAKNTQAWRTINAHLLVMLTTSAIVVVDIIVRIGQWDEGYSELSTTILSVLAAALVAVGATYGGTLVYDYQFNVESIEGSPVWDENPTNYYPKDKVHPG